MPILLGLFLSTMNVFAEYVPYEHYLRPISYYCQLNYNYCSQIRDKLERVNFDNWPDRSNGRERKFRINVVRDTSLTERAMEYSVTPSSADPYFNSDFLYIDPNWSVSQIQKRVDFVVKAHALIQTSQFRRMTCVMDLNQCIQAIESMDIYRVNGILNRAHYQNLILDNGTRAISRSLDPSVRNNTLHINITDRREIYTQLSLANKMAAVMEQLDAEEVSCVGVSDRDCSRVLETLMSLPGQVELGIEGHQEIVIAFLSYYNTAALNPYVRQFIFSPNMSVQDIVAMIAR